ncbi:MAG: trypsin-like peptidase domain-containing protein [Candidatus Dormibacteria bacterium]
MRLPRSLLPPAALLLSGAVAFAVTSARTGVSGDRRLPAPPSATAPAASPSPSLEDVALAALSRTVTVESLRSADEGLGTGWLIDTKGDFVTNAHVIAGQLTVRLRARDGSTHVGSVIASDPTTDVAVIRSDDGFAGTPLPVRTAALPLPVGVVTLASSSATGHGDITEEKATRIDATVPVTSDTDPGANTTTTLYHDMLTLDGNRIYPGNSGGPVLDSGGEVVGIVTLASKSLAEGYAIPIGRVIAELLGDAAK